MPRDRFDVLRMLFAFFFIGTFALVGLNERLRNDRRSHAVERPAIECSTIIPATFDARWP